MPSSRSRSASHGPLRSLTLPPEHLGARDDNAGEGAPIAARGVLTRASAADRPLAAGELPTRAKRRRAQRLHALAGIVVTGTEVLRGAGSAIATAHGWPSGCASWASTSPTSRSSATAREDMLRRARVHGWAGRGSDRDQRRARPDRRRSDGGGRGGFQGREMALDAELEERIAAILRGRRRAFPISTWTPCVPATASRRRSPAERPCSSRSEPRPGLGRRRPPRTPDGARGPTVVVLPGPPRELQPMWARPVGSGALDAALATLHRLPPAHAAPVRDPRVRDRGDARARPSARACELGTPGGDDLLETRRGRGRHAL